MSEQYTVWFIVNEVRIEYKAAKESVGSTIISEGVMLMCLTPRF